MKSVLFFGTFDPLHAGHRRAFLEAKSLGDYLTVVVARDSTTRTQKKRASYKSEHERVAAVASDSLVDAAILGDADTTSYNLLNKIQFDILALGYDQTPSDEQTLDLLRKQHVLLARVVRLSPYLPDTYKSSLLRKA